MTFPPPPQRPARIGFTLIELLATMGILMLLVGLLVPAVGRMRDRALESKCLVQLRSAYTAAQLYAAENNGEVVAGDIKAEGASDDGEKWSVRLVPYFNEETNTKSANFACPKWRSDATSKTAYNWGYAMNLTPGFEGTSSTSAQKQLNILTRNNDGTVTGPVFRFSGITHPNRRLFFCDSNQWHVRGQQVVAGSPGQTLASYNRHGKNRCNAVFFDGHMETLTPRGVDSAIYDPANFVNALN